MASPLNPLSNQSPSIVPQPLDRYYESSLSMALTAQAKVQIHTDYLTQLVSKISADFAKLDQIGDLAGDESGRLSPLKPETEEQLKIALASVSEESSNQYFEGLLLLQKNPQAKLEVSREYKKHVCFRIKLTMEKVKEVAAKIPGLQKNWLLLALAPPAKRKDSPSATPPVFFERSPTNFSLFSPWSPAVKGDTSDPSIPPIDLLATAAAGSDPLPSQALKKRRVIFKL